MMAINCVFFHTEQIKGLQGSFRPELKSILSIGFRLFCSLVKLFGDRVSVMPAEIHLFDIYRSANIGIFLKTNDKHCLVPKGLADTKSERISTLLKVQVLQASVAGSRLLGPLVAMNNKGIIVSRLSDDEEIRYLRESTGLNVQKLESRFTSVGNLIAS